MAALRSLSPDENSAPPEIDTSKPHSARIYDYLLGGKDNFAADREAGDQVLQAKPEIWQNVRANRCRYRGTAEAPIPWRW
jgi:hypothetical protein